MSESDFNVRLWLQKHCTMDMNRVRNLRYIVLVVLRVAAVIMLVGGFYSFIMVVVTAGPSQGFSGLFSSQGRGFNWLAYNLGLWVPGILLAYKGRLISKWIVPMPRNECLNCGYQLRSLKADHCPECGSPIPTAVQIPSKTEDQ